MAEQSSISFYSKINYINSQETIPLDLFLDGILEGHWEDIAIQIRAIVDPDQKIQKEKRRILKAEIAPSATISGLFKQRFDDKLEKPSGYLGVDVDKCDVNGIKSKLIHDPYVYSIFMSIGGDGLCIIFKINPTKHRESYAGISEYLYKAYGIVTDPHAVNPSRARFVSWDPDERRNKDALKWILYPKDKPPKKIDKCLFQEDDFNRLLEEIQKRKLNLCDDYFTYLRIGFALAHKFNEDGRQHYHTLSQYDEKYDPAKCDRQFDACLKGTGSNTTTISTFYLYAKKAGLEVYSERTKTIAYSAAQGRKAGLSPEIVAANLLKHEGIDGALDLIKQVFEDNVQINEDTLIDQLEIYMRQNYNLRRNIITRYIELDGIAVQQKELNSMFLKAKKVLEKISYELFDRLLNSDFVVDFHPIKDFFERNIERGVNTNCIERLFRSIKTIDSDYAFYFGAKWLVGMISGVYENPSPLIYILTGEEQGTGKTQFWKRFLPKELKKYYAKSKLDAGKDDAILMTQKWLIMDDEFSGKSKKEEKLLNVLTSSDIYSLREPYGRNNVDLVRLAALCSNSNNPELQSDPFGNRRLICIHVYSIDFEAYNSVDKTDLIMEAYHLYKSGFDWEVLGDEREYLNKYRLSFQVTSMEGELITKYFEPGDILMTATEIKDYIEQRTKQRLEIGRISKELIRLKFPKKRDTTGYMDRKCYCIKERIASGQQGPF